MIERCGLSQSEAADFLKISPSYIDKMCRGVRSTPDGIIAELCDLYARIDATAAGIMRSVSALAQKGVEPEDRIVCTMTDAQARERGWPCASAANAAVAIAIALCEHDFIVEPLDG
jgi:predicted transcriptional regulator